MRDLPQVPMVHTVVSAYNLGSKLLAFQGVGPATASAMLAAANPSLPFMSDEAIAAALPGKPEYKVKKYAQLVAALRKKAADLSKTSGKHLYARSWILS